MVLVILVPITPENSDFSVYIGKATHYYYYYRRKIIDLKRSNCFQIKNKFPYYT